MKNTNKKLANISNSVKGKFFTVEHKKKNKTTKYCAKIVNESPKYVTIFDINTGQDRKLGKDNLVGISCGKFTYRK